MWLDWPARSEMSRSTGWCDAKRLWPSPDGLVGRIGVASLTIVLLPDSNSRLAHTGLVGDAVAKATRPLGCGRQCAGPACRHRTPPGAARQLDAVHELLRDPTPGRHQSRERG